ncbi:MAG: mechanosensitive ion channel family protein [Chloroflexota bacterium]|nr:mechanosensitive ion channel family protein [Chloroflexota bacterium]MDE2885452.1 mechanosensitive ion channel family protein [Chloroflexota bacterium]
MSLPDFNVGDFTLDINAWASTIISALFILLVAFLIERIIRPRLLGFIVAQVREGADDETAARFATVAKAVARVASLAIWLIAGLMVLSNLGVNTTPVLASAGVVAFAISFASQNIVRDYIHGLYILTEDWYREGEVAVVAGTAGLVERVGFRRTVLRDLDGALHIIPNSQIERASNLTRDWSGINLNILVSYGAHLEDVFNVINRVGDEMKADFGDELLTAPRAERVDELAASGIEIKIVAKTEPMQQWKLTGELRKRLKERFDAEGIEIPWPHTKVYFGNTATDHG